MPVICDGPCRRVLGPKDGQFFTWNDAESTMTLTFCPKCNPKGDLHEGPIGSFASEARCDGKECFSVADQCEGHSQDCSAAKQGGAP